MSSEAKPEAEVRPEITEAQWHLIVDAIKEGECIPFLGAGVNRSGTDAESLPLGSELALKILRLMTGVTSANLSDLENAIKFHSLEEYRGRTEEAINRLREMVAGPPAGSLTSRNSRRCSKIFSPTREML